MANVVFRQLIPGYKQTSSAIASQCPTVHKKYTVTNVFDNLTINFYNTTKF